MSPSKRVALIGALASLGWLPPVIAVCLIERESRRVVRRRRGRGRVKRGKPLGGLNRAEWAQANAVKAAREFDGAGAIWAARKATIFAEAHAEQARYESIMGAATYLGHKVLATHWDHARNGVVLELDTMLAGDVGEANRVFVSQERLRDVRL